MQQKPPPMTPARVIATGKQFGQKIGKAEAKKISAFLIGWRGAKPANQVVDGNVGDYGVKP